MVNVPVVVIASGVRVRAGLRTIIGAGKRTRTGLKAALAEQSWRALALGVDPV